MVSHVRLSILGILGTAAISGGGILLKDHFFPRKISIPDNVMSIAEKYGPKEPSLKMQEAFERGKKKANIS